MNFAKVLGILFFDRTPPVAAYVFCHVTVKTVILFHFIFINTSLNRGILALGVIFIFIIFLLLFLSLFYFIIKIIIKKYHSKDFC